MVVLYLSDVYKGGNAYTISLLYKVSLSIMGRLSLVSCGHLQLSQSVGRMRVCAMFFVDYPCNVEWQHESTYTTEGLDQCYLQQNQSQD